MQMQKQLYFNNYKNTITITMKKALLTLTAIITIGININAQTRWKTYETSDYSIQYPPKWELNTKNDINVAGVDFQLIAPDDDESAMVQLVISETEADSFDDIDIKAYQKELPKLLNSMLKKFSLIESKELRNSSGTYIRLTFTFEHMTKMKAIYYIFIADGACYTLEFMVPQKDFEKYKKTGEDILNTFRIKE